MIESAKKTACGQQPARSLWCLQRRVRIYTAPRYPMA